MPDKEITHRRLIWGSMGAEVLTVLLHLPGERSSWISPRRLNTSSDILKLLAATKRSKSCSFRNAAFWFRRHL